MTPGKSNDMLQARQLGMIVAARLVGLQDVQLSAIADQRRPRLFVKVLGALHRFKEA